MSLNNILKKTLSHIRIVLIQTSHPGNIGSAARAMKTMGLENLVLVKPKKFPDEQATTMSSNAQDILEKARVVDSLEEAVADCELVVGSSARDKRSLAWDIVEPRECCERAVKRIVAGEKASKVALVFGRESSGLTNDELALCQHLVHIPTNSEYSSLNIASAVQLLCYECRLSAISLSQNEEKNETMSKKDLVTAKELEGYYQHLETAMIGSSFLDPENPKHLMTRLRRLYARSQMTRSELNILRGMLSAFQKKY